MRIPTVGNSNEPDSGDSGCPQRSDRSEILRQIKRVERLPEGPVTEGRPGRSTRSSRSVIGDEQVITVRPADLLEPGLEKAEQDIKRFITKRRRLIYIYFLTRRLRSLRDGRRAGGLETERAAPADASGCPQVLELMRTTAADRAGDVVGTLINVVAIPLIRSRHGVQHQTS